MEDLRTLDLAFNRLTSLPKEVAWHASLLKLNLSSNQLREVPSSLVFLLSKNRTSFVSLMVGPKILLLRVAVTAVAGQQNRESRRLCLSRLIGGAQSVE